MAAAAFYLIIVLHVVACLFLIGVVLLQQGKSQDLASAFGGGGSQTAFGPRGSANVLSKATTILAGAFMITSLALSVLRPARSSVLDKAGTAAPSPSPAAGVTTPTLVPAAPPATSPAAPPASPAPQQ
jgi:preprotein translocase subunit SecG